MTVVYGFIRLCSLVSLIVFPQFISLSFTKLRDVFLSYRFALIVKAKGRVHLQKPFYILGHKYLEIGDKFGGGPGLRIECIEEYEGQRYIPSIKIGNNVSFNFNCHIGAINKIIIGNNVLVGSHVLITDHSHGINSYDEMNTSPNKRKLYSKGTVHIENDVWIGEGVVVLPNVTIGHHSIIGANSVVNKNIPAYSLVAGNPAKVVRKINTCDCE